MARILCCFVAAMLSFAACGDDEGAPYDSPSEVLGDADEGIEGVQAIRVYYPQGPHRDGDIDYGLRPHAGGLHDPIWWNCGFYDEPVREENVGHSLEHGAVWIAYTPDLPSAEVEAIHELVRQNPKVLAAPYEGLAADEAVVASAWARQLRLESATDPRLAEFVAQYQDSSQAPEAGATCIGSSVGQPFP